ncbi:hypothetical protein [Thermosipho sp. (in: thermotogales)]|jgi:hypothetical protein|uniref:hypothetical protein n=1 Tax=Thermosipho sp. (in: thermotogales) TaxID=1968895 RepID=UPI00257C513C|nr:hypothetical protein [Thermosipho sp. (in: thermotogales)]MBZ4649278.1 hypothetical protein [Thermosipho sp. (in: thermotogales)]
MKKLRMIIKQLFLILDGIFKLLITLLIVGIRFILQLIIFVVVCCIYFVIILYRKIKIYLR